MNDELDILAEMLGSDVQAAEVTLVSTPAADPIEVPKAVLERRAFTKRYGKLIASYGSPVVYGPRGALSWNEVFFAAKFKMDTAMLFSPEENRFYIYDSESGVWEHQSEAWLRVRIFEGMFAYAQMQGLANQLPFDLDDRSLKALVSHLKGVAEQRNAFERSHDLLHVRNGMLDLSSGTPVLKRFNREYRSRNRVPLNYDPAAKCPTFLGSLLSPALPPDDIDLLQRWAGSVLLGGNRAQRILVITGVAGGGKSTILSVIEDAIGPQNIAELRVDQLGGRFEKSRFVGKSLLVGKDVRSDYLTDKSVSTLKSLTGGDRMTAEMKGSNEVIPIRGDFGIAITSNASLRLKLDDDADAWRRRLLLIPFTGKPSAKPVPGFADELVRSEGEGILAWMVEGAIKHVAELKSCGSYVLTATQQARIQELLAESNSVGEFFDKCVIRDDKSDATTDELLSAYEGYCSDQDWTPVSGKAFREQAKQKMADKFGISQSHDIGRLGGFGRYLRGYRKTRIVERKEESPVVPHATVPRTYSGAINSRNDLPF